MKQIDNYNDEEEEEQQQYSFCSITLQSLS